MSTHLEIEYKASLDYPTYLSYLNHFPSAQVSTHQNHYFLYSNASLRLAARIREEEQQMTLTFKVEQPVGRLEVNFSVDSTDLSIFNREDIKTFLNQHQLNGTFKPIGTLTTQRHTVHEMYGDLCLDVSHYLGKTDYELEYEVTQDAPLAYQRFLEILQLEHLEPLEPPTKFARFLEQKRLTETL